MEINKLKSRLIFIVLYKDNNFLNIRIKTVHCWITTAFYNSKRLKHVNEKQYNNLKLYVASFLNYT